MMSTRKRLNTPALEDLYKNLGAIISSNQPEVENSAEVEQDQDNTDEVEIDDNATRNYKLFKSTNKFLLTAKLVNLSFDISSIVIDYNSLKSEKNNPEFGQMYNKFIAAFRAIDRNSLEEAYDKLIYDILDCLLLDIELYPYLVGMSDVLTAKETIAMFHHCGANIIECKKKFEALHKNYSVKEISAVLPALKAFKTRIANNINLHPSRLVIALENLGKSANGLDMDAERAKLKRKMIEAKRKRHDSENDSDNEESISSSKAGIDNGNDNVVKETPVVGLPAAIPVQSYEEQLVELSELTTKEKELEETLMVFAKKAKRAFPVIDECIKAEQQKLSVNVEELAGLINEASKFAGPDLILPGELDGIPLPLRDASKEDAESNHAFFKSYAFRSNRVDERRVVQNGLRAELQEKIALCRDLVNQHREFLAQEKEMLKIRATFSAEINANIDALKDNVNPYAFFGKSIVDITLEGTALQRKILSNQAREKALNASIQELEKSILEQTAELAAVLDILNKKEARDKERHQVAMKAAEQYDAEKNPGLKSIQFRGSK